MNTRKFFSPDEVALIRQNIKTGAMTVDDIHIIVKNELNGIYNTILSSLFCRKITDSPTAIDSDSIPENADDIDGYSMYCVTYDAQKEIAEAEGVNPEDVVLYEYHERRQPYYTIAV